MSVAHRSFKRRNRFRSASWATSDTSDTWVTLWQMQRSHENSTFLVDVPIQISSAGIVSCHVGRPQGKIWELYRGCTVFPSIYWDMAGSACCMAGSARATSGPSSTVPESRCRKCSLLRKASLQWLGLLVTLEQLNKAMGTGPFRWFIMIYHDLPSMKHDGFGQLWSATKELRALYPRNSLLGARSCWFSC